MTHKHTHPELQYNHSFNGDNRRNERKTLQVVVLTVIMMVAEIAAGYLFGSMALLADGWHMGTHAVALGITLLGSTFIPGVMQITPVLRLVQAKWAFWAVSAVPCCCKWWQFSWWWNPSSA